MYAAVFIDAVVVKNRGGQVANRVISEAIGVSLADVKDGLELWAGNGGEGAKFWMSVPEVHGPSRWTPRWVLGGLCACVLAHFVMLPRTIPLTIILAVVAMVRRHLAGPFFVATGEGPGQGPASHPQERP